MSYQFAIDLPVRWKDDVSHGSDLLTTATATLVWIDGNLQSILIPDSARSKIADLEGIPSR